MNTRKLLFRGLFLFGMVSISFVLGAYVMFFDHYPSGFLKKAFLGGDAVNKKYHDQFDPYVNQATPPFLDKPGKTFDGFTLYMIAKESGDNTKAVLVNMHGDPVHTWTIPFSKVWPSPPHIREKVNDARVCFFSGHLFPDGSLLVVLQGNQNSMNGYGLVKLDKDSNVIWKHADNCHHDLDVGEDGTIYAIKHVNAQVLPEGLDFINPPALLDSLVILKPDQEEQSKPIPILEAFRDSAKYKTLLSDLEKRKGHPGQPPPMFGGFMWEMRQRDPLHMNFVQVLTPRLAPKFKQLNLKAGQVLISMRHLDAIAVIDPETRNLVWAARGPWRGQHDAQFLDNGHILLFDNLGWPRGSRVLEYDPVDQSFPWTYNGENRGLFFSLERGMCQRLPNNNTLIVSSQDHEIFEVTHDKELVWRYGCEGMVHLGRRYSAAQLPFLKDVSPRPDK